MTVPKDVNLGQFEELVLNKYRIFKVGVNSQITKYLPMDFKIKLTCSMDGLSEELAE
jgi:hypothetical protein